MGNKKFVTEIIGDGFLQWKKGEKIVISTQTGSGKTTFVVSALLKHAVQMKKHIVYYCNRKVLYDQFSAESKDKIREVFGETVANSYGAEQYLHICTYQGSELIENYPRVTVKISETESIVLEVSDVLYYVFDEAHYFINDAMINERTNFWYDIGFQHGISVFLTATPKPLLAFFAGQKRLCEERNSHLYKQLKKANEKREMLGSVVPEAVEAFSLVCKDVGVIPVLPTNKKIISAVKRRMEHPLQEWFNCFDALFQGKDNEVRWYDQPKDYTYVDPYYFLEYDELIPEIAKTQNEKWLIFVDNEREGAALYGELKGRNISAAFLSARSIKQEKTAQETYEAIVWEEAFSNRVLIATSALDCGINIKDNSVQNIAIASDNETTFLQMLGRKRLTEKEKSIRLFVKSYDLKSINGRQHAIDELFRDLLHFSLKNSIGVIRNRKRYRNDPYDDGTDYGSLLSADELNRSIEHILSNKKMALFRRVGPKQQADCNGHIKLARAETRVRDKYNNDMVLDGLAYSKTAFLYVLLQKYSYEQAMNGKHIENDDYRKLCEHIKKCVDALPDGTPTSAMVNAFFLDRGLISDRMQRFAFLSKPVPPNMTLNFKKGVERDRFYYLRYQLSWIGKSYDERRWVGYDVLMDGLTDYLDSLADQYLKEDDAFDEQRDFAEKCMELMEKLPFCPEILKTDISRYKQHNEKFPGKSKLNKCFAELSLPFVIVSQQKKYDGVDKKKSCWVLKRL